MTFPPASDFADSPASQASSPFVHAALEAVVVVDQDQRIVMINPAGLAMFGLTREQALGMHLEQLLPERFRLPHRQHVQRFGDSGETERPMGARGDILGVRANGEEFPLEAAIFRSEVVQPWGTQTYYTALLRDLSELRRLSSVIEQLNQRLRSLLDRLPAAICITEAQRVVYANRACARLMGLSSPATLLGRGIVEFLCAGSPEALRAQLGRLSDADADVVTPATLQHADGSWREVELTMAELPDHERRFVQIAINDVTQRSREKKDLLRSRRALREWSASMVEAREEERQRIARELHDELGQRLTAMKLELTACMRDHPNPALAERAQGMLDMLDETVASARRIAMDLRPLMLDDLGLVAALEWLVQDFSRRSHIPVQLRLCPVPGALPSKTGTTLYRIVQEALTNITRHAKASRVRVELEEVGHELRLSIQDNGIGFPSQPQPRRAHSFGLLGIRERVLMLGGRLVLGHSDEGGARLLVRLPLPASPVPTSVDDDGPDLAGPFFEESVRGPLG